MTVYVGMDVHRKRSQIAVLDAAGEEQRNRNVPNDPVKLVPILGVLPPGTPVAFEAADGWGWLVELLEELELEPHLVHPAAVRRSPRPGSRTTRSMRPPWPSCSGPTCSPRPGSPRRRSVTCGPCCATGPAWSGWPPD